MGKSLEALNNLVEAAIGDRSDGAGALGFADPGDIRRIAMAMLELADALEPLDAHVRDAAPKDGFDDTELAAAAKCHYLLRRRRSAYLPAELFAEPAWDLLLDIFISTVSGNRILTKSLCGATDVPTSTTLRWIGILETCGLITRSTPLDDKRLTTIQMTAEGYTKVRECLSDWATISKRDFRKMKLALMP